VYRTDEKRALKRERQTPHDGVSQRNRIIIIITCTVVRGCYYHGREMIIAFVFMGRERVVVEKRGDIDAGEYYYYYNNIIGESKYYKKFLVVGRTEIILT